MFINKSHVKEYALYIAKTYRPAVGFTRVSDTFYQRIDAQVRRLIGDEVQRLPSKGVTIK